MDLSLKVWIELFSFFQFFCLFIFVFCGLFLPLLRSLKAQLRDRNIVNLRWLGVISKLIYYKGFKKKVIALDMT